MPAPSLRSSLPIALVLLSMLGHVAAAAGPESLTLDAIAEAYVRLGLAAGQHDPDYVDAYHDPAEWKEEATATTISPEEIRGRAQALLAALDETSPDGSDELLVLRQRYLRGQLQALVGRLDVLAGKRLSFDGLVR